MLILLLQECSSLTCIPMQGSCVDDICVCNLGFYGENCSMDESECGETHCNREGECTEVLPNGFSCICNGNFYGLSCNLTFEQCEQQLCNSRGNCTSHGTCICDFNFDAGTRCLACLSNHVEVGDQCYRQECVSQQVVCSDQGECADGICKCVVDHYGALCEYDQETCNEEVCNSNGICQIIEKSFECACMRGYTGNNCSKCSESYEMIEEQCYHTACVQNDLVCNSNGSCEESGNVSFCNCQPGLFGSYCTFNQSECNTNICSGNGECEPKIGQHQECNCNSGFEPGVCDECQPTFVQISKECWPEECVLAGVLCSGSGNCIERQCKCTSGYFGEFCEMDAKTCSTTLCNGHGNCTTNGNEVECVCNGLFLLPYCENCSSGHINLNETCVPSLCVNESLVCSNHGTCDVNGCECHSGFYNRLCDLNETECDDSRCNSNGICENAGCNCNFPWSGISCNSCVGDAFQMLNGGCYSINCIANEVVCSDHGECHNVKGTCECGDGFYGSMCELDERKCDEIHCSSHGSCTMGAIESCVCDNAYAAPVCKECNAEGGFVQALNGEIKVCVPKTCVREIGEQVCEGNGECKNGTCSCGPDFIGALCHINETACSFHNCSNEGQCFFSNDTIACNCSGGRIAAKCCAMGSIAGQCITPQIIGLICAIIGLIIVAVVGTALIMCWRRRIEKSKEHRAKSKYYTMEELRLFDGGSGNFFI